MPTKISFQTWSGGSGAGDPKILIGYCKEEPQEVLKQVYKDHYIYNYQDLYRPVDYDYPNNVIGLIIEKVSSSPNGTEIIGTLKDLDLSRAYDEKIKRDIETFKRGIKNAMQWHNYSREELKIKYELQFKEVKEVLLGDRNAIVV